MSESADTPCIAEHFPSKNEHYLGDVQPIELMQAQFHPQAFIGFLQGNIIKYASRLGKKDMLHKETEKILQYATWLHQMARGEKITVPKPSPRT